MEYKGYIFDDEILDFIITQTKPIANDSRFQFEIYDFRSERPLNTIVRRGTVITMK